MNFVVILAYCVFCLVISAVTMKFLKTSWVYLIVSSTVPPMILIGADVLWRGYLDAWADIAFVVSWLIAFGCAIGYYIMGRLMSKGVLVENGPNDSLKR